MSTSKTLQKIDEAKRVWSLSDHCVGDDLRMGVDDLRMADHHRVTLPSAPKPRTDNRYFIRAVVHDVVQGHGSPIVLMVITCLGQEISRSVIEACNDCPKKNEILQAIKECEDFLNRYHELGLEPGPDDVVLFERIVS